MEEKDWRRPNARFILTGELPSEGVEARKIKSQSYNSRCKCVEAAPLKNTRAQDMEEFIWKNSITRLGIPRIIISDNGPQFDVAVIREMWQRLGIKLKFTPVCYPQYNGQVEVKNKPIFLSTMVKWYEELAYYGPIEPHPPMPLEKRRSAWSTAQKRCFP
ncbi:hypothetical protein LIER_35125 [Lithospermum erythrorhizon]|uniref:Integrase catalytic domain-containing protein n=1 Tax=Lithospermum erythrorhizon TaxID=34254 RepID=A0AAV3NK40_LITER